MFKVNLISILFIVFSCNNDNSSIKENSNFVEDEMSSKKNDRKPTETKAYSPVDSSLVEGLAIWSPLRTEQFFSKYILGDNNNRSYDKIIRNVDGTQNMKLTHLPGSDENTYRYIEIYWNRKNLKGDRTNSIIKEFITNSRVKLGKSIDSFCEIKNIAPDQILDNNNTYIYNTVIDGLGYRSKYLFDINYKLEKFEFGYDNP